jgi:predicted HTH domain antitoxin
MKALKIAVPDDLDLAIGSSPEELAQMARVALALRLFELGKITSGRAADVAGISHRQFLVETTRNRIPAVVWDDEELVAEDAAVRSLS